MSLFDIFSASDGKKAATAAHNARTTGLRTGEKRAFGYMDQGLAGATPQYEKAISLFDDYTRTGGAAAGAYGDAIGLGGDEGYARAHEAFRAGPGYQFAVDEATEAAKRNASSLGMLGSGNTLMAISDRAQGLADQQWSQYLDNLYRASGQGLNAAGAQAGHISSYGDTIYGHNAAKAQLAHGTELGVGQSEAQRVADWHQAKQAASGNVWNAVMGVAQMAAGMPPSFWGNIGGGGGDVGTGSWMPVVTRA